MLCDGHGIENNQFVSTWNMIDSGGAGLCGIYLGPLCASSRLSNMKAWYSGQIDRVTYGQGILFDGAFINELSNIETQNSGAEGIVFLNAQGNMLSSVRVEFPPNPANTCNGMRLIDSNNNTIHSLSISDRGSTPYSLNYALSLERVTTGCIKNFIDINIGNCLQGLTIQVTGGQTLANNDIYVNTIYHNVTKQNFGLIPKYANDAAAAAAGLAIGDEYWNSVTGAMHMRLV